MNLQHLLNIGLSVQSLSDAKKASSPEANVKAAANNPAAKGAKVAPAAGAPPKAPEERRVVPENALSKPAAHKTVPLYMDGTYVFECSAKLLDVWEDADKVCVELDQTVFHPQGGGQPSDIGWLESEGLPKLEVAFVAKDKVREGVIRHECKGDTAAWFAAKSKGVKVLCKVDEAKRRMHARLHSAGHLLDVGVFALGFRWQPGKGYHFEDGPYVEYIVGKEGRQLDNKDAKAKEAVMQELADKMKELIAKSVPTQVGFVDGMRTVTMDGVSCGCGGTHVESSTEIGEVVIKKMQAKQGNMRVSYTVR
eukprot:TRINITY_DN18120_c0_g1_i1.p1 TRINITY_DN18120_c0_g1~~TRINITY_DN18120_c0_g1_i1.p1  ORF type:complete len:308 (-),score=88.20 TRINITY_DN18120_c0_g1_i1:243-1166(-)